MSEPEDARVAGMGKMHEADNTVHPFFGTWSAMSADASDC
jgi:hypothetical protein